MRELDIPEGVDQDPDATEMVRFWIAGGRPHVALLLGMYADAEDSGVDELTAWGYILSDIAQHVANGLAQNHGEDFEASVRTLAECFREAIAERAPSLEEGYLDDDA